MHVNLDEAVYAGFWARFFASALDSIVQLLLIIPLLYILYGSVVFSTSEFDTGVVGALIQLISVPFLTPEFDKGMTGMFIQLLPMIWVILFWRFKSATPGKIMMGISIVDATTGDTPRLLKLILRYFGYLVSIIPCLLGFFWVAWDKRKQGFHDMIANTVVVMNPREDSE
jgi:uncharacterized RDD family membrane protein YckC